MSSAPQDPLRVVAHLLRASGAIPNHPRWPLLVYPAPVPIHGGHPAVAFEALFDRNGWPPAWRNGVYPDHHFHCDAHEALGIFSGEVTVQCGGDGGVALTARPGATTSWRASAHPACCATSSCGHSGAPDLLAELDMDPLTTPGVLMA